jgi:hypothetical protein
MTIVRIFRSAFAALGIIAKPAEPEPHAAAIKPKARGGRPRIHANPAARTRAWRGRKRARDETCDETFRHRDETCDETSRAPPCLSSLNRDVDGDGDARAQPIDEKLVKLPISDHVVSQIAIEVEQIVKGKGHWSSNRWHRPDAERAIASYLRQGVSRKTIIDGVYRVASRAPEGPILSFAYFCQKDGIPLEHHNATAQQELPLGVAPRPISIRNPGAANGRRRSTPSTWDAKIAEQRARESAAGLGHAVAGDVASNGDDEAATGFMAAEA